MTRNKEYNGIKYRRLNKLNCDETYIDEQFKQLPTKIPWKAICLASLLFIGGITLLVLGTLVVTGQLDTKYGDRTWPFFILGIIMFLPGAYHVRIAYYAFQGYQGFSFDEIPEFE